MIDPVTGAIIGQSILGAGSAASNYAVGSSNYTAQKHNLEWQQKAQRITWAREDNAAQRRAADMQKAGLSKTLAAGNVAQTSTPVHTQAPQRERGAFDIAGNFVNITQTMAQAQLIRAQADYQEQVNKTNKPEQEVTNLKATFDSLLQTIKTQKAIEAKNLTDIEIAKYNKMWAQIANVSTNASGLSQMWGTGVNTLVNEGKRIDQAVQQKKMNLQQANEVWAKAIENATKQAIKEGLKPSTWDLLERGKK